MIKDIKSEERKLKETLATKRSVAMTRWKTVINKKVQSEAYNTVIHIDTFKKIKSFMKK